MTRREAHQYRPPEKFEEDGDGFRLLMPLQDHIDTTDAIYDGIEESVCKTCKHRRDEGLTQWCNLLDIQITKDFGCKKWEKK